MVRRIAYLITVLTLILTLGTLTVSASSELKIKVLENESFKINGDEVQIVGLVEVTKGDLYLTAKEIIYNSAVKTAVITGQPVLKTIDATVNGERIEADFEGETFTFTGSVQVEQEERVALADEVQVDNSKNTYLLLGNVLITEEQDEKELRAEEVLIISDEDIIEVKGPVEVSFIIAETEESAKSNSDQTSSEEVYVEVTDVSRELQ